MANFKSDQITKLDNVPVDKLTPDEAHGRQRIAYFKFTAPTGGLAIADTIDLCEVPSGRPGGASHSAAAITVSAAGAALFGNTQALNYGEKLTEKARVFATLAGGTMAQGLVLEGHVNSVAE